MDATVKLLEADWDFTLDHKLVEHVKAAEIIHLHAAPFNGVVIASVLLAKNLKGKCMVINDSSDSHPIDVITGYLIADADVAIIDSKYIINEMDDYIGKCKLIVHHQERKGEMHLLENNSIVVKIIPEGTMGNLELTWFDPISNKKQITLYDLNKMPELK